jgi:hypothetical protein
MPLCPQYHPDPEINAEVALERARGELLDIRAGYPVSRWTCPDCGRSHRRGFMPGSLAHRCLWCGYVGTGGFIEPAPGP